MKAKCGSCEGNIEVEETYSGRLSACEDCGEMKVWSEHELVESIPPAFRGEDDLAEFLQPLSGDDDLIKDTELTGMTLI